MNMPLAILNRRRRGFTAFSPSALFALAEPGVWYDPSDLTTLFQDTAGTTPVTTPAQTVALMLDKSKGLALGTEQFVAASATETSGVVQTGTSNDWVMTAAALNGSAIAYDAGFATNVGKSYIVQYEVYDYVSGSVAPRMQGTNGPTASSNGVYRHIYLATAVGNFIGVGTLSTSTLKIRNISVRELAGNHATQATAASRPTFGVVPLGGRRNLLTFTEQFDNVVWTKTNATITANAEVSPDGTITADLLYPNSSGTNRWVYQSYTGTSDIYTRSVYAKASGKNFLCIDPTGSGTVSVYFNLSTGAVGTVSSGYTASIQSVGAGWYRCSVRNTSNTTLNFGGVYAVVDADNSRAVTASGTDGILIWGAQLELGSTATPYQRVSTAFDVTEAGVQSLSYLSFDGVDDFMVTGTITPGTDKVQVFAGVRKLSDAAVAFVAELSVSAGGNAGAFSLTAPQSVTPTYGFNSRGSAALTGATYNNAAVAAPTVNVVTGLGDISGDRATLRVNGIQVAQSIVDQGTGNYLAYPIYLGRRGGTSLPFNGNIFSLIVRFGANLDTTAITDTETWVNGKTGAYA